MTRTAGDSRRSSEHLRNEKPISVCIIDENLPVPMDTRVWKEACALRDAGYHVSVICPKGQDGFRSSYEALEDIEIYRHMALNAGSPMGYICEYTFSLVVEFVLALWVFIRNGFRVLQACNPPDLSFLLGLFFKVFGVRFVFDHHDLVPELFETKFGRREGILYRLVTLAERLAFGTADVSIATNESYRKVAIIRGKKRPDRVFVVRNNPDLDVVQRVKPRMELKRGKALLVAYVGIMNQQDGVELLLHSIDYIVKHEGRRDTHFVFVGIGSELPRLRALVAEKRLDSFVTFAGWLSREEIDAYVSTADVCVAPDPYNPLNDASTMVKTLEYMAYGRPVVQFALTEGRYSAAEASLYAKPNDPVDFAEQIIRLLNSETLRHELGQRGRKRVEERFNWDSEKKTLLQAYKTALELPQIPPRPSNSSLVDPNRVGPC